MRIIYKSQYIQQYEKKQFIEKICLTNQCKFHYLQVCVCVSVCQCYLVSYSNDGLGVYFHTHSTTQLGDIQQGCTCTVTPSELTDHLKPHLSQSHVQFLNKILSTLMSHQHMYCRYSSIYIYHIPQAQNSRALFNG